MAFPIKKLLCSILLGAMLAGCAHPDLIKMNTPYEVVVAKLGTPDSTSTDENGNVRLVYTGQPFGQASYVMIFNKEGKLVEEYNILQEKYFPLIKPKVMNSEDIFILLGPPTDKWNFKMLGEKSWMYRFEDIGGNAMALWVDFDGKTDEVIRYVISDDPWKDRKFPWF